MLTVILFLVGIFLTIAGVYPWGPICMILAIAKWILIH